MRPVREHATSNGQTYMITTSTWGRRSLFSREVWAKLLIDTLYRYRGSAYLLHEFVVMPDHIHVILTAKTSLEKAVQFIKRGFSYRAKKELDSNMEVWQRGFSDHRIRDASDYRLHQIYVRQNPVRKNLCERAGEYPYSSTHGGCDLDTVPQGLKPATLREADAARLEGAPFQSKNSSAKLAGGLLQAHGKNAVPEAGRSPRKAPGGALEAPLPQSKRKTAS